VEFRRDAAGRILEHARTLFDAGRKVEAATEYRRALQTTRDDDQVRIASDRLKDLGERVDLPRHFGFLMEWKVIGPFDNTGSRAFNVAYPPESEADHGAAYDGKTGKVSWKDLITSDDYGLVDLNKPVGRHKGAIAYALAEFGSDRARRIELRLGCATAWKLWVNGRLLFAHEEYHHGMEMDQFRVEGDLREGRNMILLKVCQNEQTEDYADFWQFQLRVCDAAGTAVLSTKRPDRAPDASQRSEEKKP